MSSRFLLIVVCAATFVVTLILSARRRSNVFRRAFFYLESTILNNQYRHPGLGGSFPGRYRFFYLGFLVPERRRSRTSLSDTSRHREGQRFPRQIDLRENDV
jgi:hypothetical protein